MAMPSSIRVASDTSGHPTKKHLGDYLPDQLILPAKTPKHRTVARPADPTPRNAHIAYDIKARPNLPGLTPISKVSTLGAPLLTPSSNEPQKLFLHIQL